MTTILGTNSMGRVLLVIDGDAAGMPTEFNGDVITAHELTEVQRLSYEALPSDRSETTFDGREFNFSPAIPPNYAELRAAKYPTMAMYLDAVVKGDEAQKQAYIDACLAVKAKYPKP